MPYLGLISRDSNTGYVIFERASLLDKLLPHVHIEALYHTRFIQSEEERTDATLEDAL